MPSDEAPWRVRGLRNDSAVESDMLPFSPNPYKPVEQGNVGLVTKFGRFARAVDPGLVKINPLSESLLKVDVKIQIVGQ